MYWYPQPEYWFPFPGGLVLGDRICGVKPPGLFTLEVLRVRREVLLFFIYKLANYLPSTKLGYKDAFFIAIATIP